MNTEVGFDLISDLFLSPDECFNWQNKATSLFCIVAGNISSNLSTVFQTLAHLGKHYQGVFYVPGTLEYEDSDSVIECTEKIKDLLSDLPNVCLLHQNVAIIDGVAIVGVNGWNNVGDTFTVENLLQTASRHDDFNYLYGALEKLQRRPYVKKIIVVSNSVPHNSLYFGEIPIISNDQTPMYAALAGDTENKVSHWLFGTYEKNVDTHIDGIHFINNPYLHRLPYWSRRVSVSL